MSTLERVARALGYATAGAAATAVAALGLLYATSPAQALLYRAVYLPLGPSAATQTAVLTHFLAVSAVALAVALVLGDSLSERVAHPRLVARAAAALLAVVPAFFVVAFAGLAALPVALALLVVAGAGVPLTLRYRYGVRSGGLPAVAGGTAVVVFLVLVAGVGLGWGWGYVATAEQVPASSVDGPVVTFEDAPAVASDLFASGNCEGSGDGRTCYLELRGYEHERAAARFLAAHGVRCPYTNAPSASAGSFLARYRGAYWRVSCAAHGD